MKRKATATPKPDASESPVSSPTSATGSFPPSATGSFPPLRHSLTHSLPPSLTSPPPTHCPQPAAAAGSMRKHKPHKPHVRWSDAEERMLLDAVNAHIAANGGLWNAVKTDPVLGARSRAGVKAHWESMVSYHGGVVLTAVTVPPHV